MNIKRKHLYFRLFLSTSMLIVRAVLLAEASSVNAEEDKEYPIAAEFTLTTNKFSVQGPIIAFLTVTNLTSERVNVLFPERYVRIAVSRKGEAQPDLPPDRRYRVGLDRHETLNPNDVYRRPILLETGSFDHTPGQYDVLLEGILDFIGFDPKKGQHPFPYPPTIRVTDTLSLTLIDGDDPSITNIFADIAALATDVDSPLQNRQAVARTFSKVKHPAAIPYLIELLDVVLENPVWRYAVEGLIEIGTPEAVRTLIDVPDKVTEDPSSRGWYISEVNRQLRKLVETTDDIPVLMEILRLENAGIRYDVLCRLRDLGDTQCFEIAKKMLSDPNPDMRNTARKFLDNSTNHQSELKETQETPD